MSSLDRQLKKQCKRMLHGLSIPRASRIEIEDYFLCEIQRLMESGLSLQESVEQASKNFGSMRAISDELTELQSGLAWYRKSRCVDWIHNKIDIARDALIPPVACVGAFLLFGLLIKQFCNLSLRLDRVLLDCASFANFILGN